MFLHIIRLFIVFVLLLFPKTAYSENIAYIDIDFIMNNSLAGKSITIKLEQNYKIEDDNFKKIGNDLKNKEKKLISQKNILNEEEYKKKVNILVGKINKYKENRNIFLKEFKSKKIESTKIWIKKINQILVDYSKENSIGIILQKKNIVIGKNDLDITQDIIKILNNKVKKIEIN